MNKSEKAPKLKFRLYHIWRNKGIIAGRYRLDIAGHRHIKELDNSTVVLQRIPSNTTLVIPYTEWYSRLIEGSFRLLSVYEDVEIELNNIWETENE